jgi:hypothetical protein
MKLIYSLWFMWAMSIGILIIPSLVAFPAYINLVGLALIIMLHNTFDYKFKSYNSFVIPVVIYIILSSVASMNEGPINFSKQFLTLGFLALSFASASEKQQINLLKTYLYFCFFMSICGSMASILINTELVNLNEFKLSLTDISSGRFNWDVDIENGFNAPYGLGLVLTKGSSLYYFLGIPFYRSSGWSYEPTFASFFVVPSLILLIRENLINKKIRLIMGAVILFFLFCCFSVASFAALLSLFVIFKILDPAKKGSKKIFWIFVIGFIGLFVVNLYNTFKIEQPGIDLIESKLTEDSLSGINIFNISGKSISDLSYLAILVLYITFIASYAISAIRNSGLKQTMGLILLYFILHSVKGNWYHTMTLNITFIFFLYLTSNKIYNFENSKK